MNFKSKDLWLVFGQKRRSDWIAQKEKPCEGFPEECTVNYNQYCVISRTVEGVVHVVNLLAAGTIEFYTVLILLVIQACGKERSPLTTVAWTVAKFRAHVSFVLLINEICHLYYFVHSLLCHNVTLMDLLIYGVRFLFYHHLLIFIVYAWFLSDTSTTTYSNH